MTFNYVITLIKSVVNKNKNNCYYSIFLEKGSYKDKSNTEHFQMLYFDRIDVTEGTDANKTIASKEWDICHYCFFLNYSFKFQSNVCNRCQDLLMMLMNLNDIAILNIKDSDYHCIINIISVNKATNLIQNADLTEKSGTL